MRRRDFITAFVGSAAACVTGARAQQADRVRRIGVLMHVTEKDQDGQARLAAFVQRLKELGWIEGAICAWTFGGARLTPIATRDKPPSWFR
jgi:putative tryptophan/tyrosine transport system substrate-binding protein